MTICKRKQARNRFGAFGQCHRIRFMRCEPLIRRVLCKNGGVKKDFIAAENFSNLGKTGVRFLHLARDSWVFALSREASFAQSRKYFAAALRASQAAPTFNASIGDENGISFNRGPDMQLIDSGAMATPFPASTAEMRLVTLSCSSVIRSLSLRAPNTLLRSSWYSGYSFREYAMRGYSSTSAEITLFFWPSG